MHSTEPRHIFHIGSSICEFVWVCKWIHTKAEAKKKTRKNGASNNSDIRTRCLNRIWNVATTVCYWPGSVSNVYSNVYVVSFGFHFIWPYRCKSKICNPNMRSTDLSTHTHTHSFSYLNKDSWWMTLKHSLSRNGFLSSFYLFHTPPPPTSSLSLFHSLYDQSFLH